MKSINYQLLCFFVFLFATNKNTCGSVVEVLYLQDTLQIELDSVPALFQEDLPVEITFEFDIRSFLRSRNREEYLDAVMTMNIPAKDAVVQPMRIRARGNFRKSICAFPPMLINPRKADSISGVIMNNRNIKLVTHCQNAGIYEQYVLKEYLVYRLYNLLTAYSFKVRLARIKYVDSARRHDTMIRYGFFIENIEDLAERNSAVVLDNELLKQSDMMPEIMVQMAVFAYMIGNFDWYTSRPHNIETIKALDVYTEKAIPVPYDFDFSGLVDAPYAIPREDLGISTIQERVYLGICSHQDQWNDVLDTFLEMKDTFYDVIRDFNWLDEQNKEQMISYIALFYKLLQERNEMIRIMQRECRQSEPTIKVVR